MPKAKSVTEKCNACYTGCAKCTALETCTECKVDADGNAGKLMSGSVLDD